MRKGHFLSGARPDAVEERGTFVLFLSVQPHASGFFLNTTQKGGESDGHSL